MCGYVEKIHFTHPMLKVRSSTFHPRLAQMDSATVDFQKKKGGNAANFVRLSFTGLLPIVQHQECNCMRNHRDTQT